uniref:Putative secreted peptide n=1 Tax=Anopheles braziliensis TaxID=58242 RepID=A0A2M3ZQE4_9DIPT
MVGWLAVAVAVAAVELLLLVRKHQHTQHSQAENTRSRRCDCFCARYCSAVLNLMVITFINGTRRSRQADWRARGWTALGATHVKVAQRVLRWHPETAERWLVEDLSADNNVATTRQTHAGCTCTRIFW